MPSLSPADRERLLGPRGTCSGCGRPLVRQYCRSCDEFFATCDCVKGEEHAAHRVYLWTSSGVRAVPNFDRF